MRQITVATDALGRATVQGLNPLNKGVFQIQVHVVANGQTTAATIHQANVATAAEAAVAPLPSAAAASGASSAAAAAGGAVAAGGSGGGLSAAAIAGIVAGIAGGATAVGVAATKKGGTPPNTPIAVSVSGTAPRVGGTSQFKATLTLNDDSTQDITSSADTRWGFTGGPPQPASVSLSGLVTGVFEGVVEIEAVYHNELAGRLTIVITR